MSSNELTLHQLLRCRHVKRWHIVRTTREQSVAEHQWAVAMIAWEICERLKAHRVFNGELMLVLMEWALIHDTPEVITGDLPTPTSVALGHALEDKEHAVSQRWSVRRNWSRTAADGLPATIIKLADLIEMISFLQDDGVGEHARRVAWVLHARLNDTVKAASERHPAYEWDSVVNAVLSAAMTIEGDGHD